MRNTACGQFTNLIILDANRPVDQNRSSMKRRSYVYTIQQNYDQTIKTTQDKDLVELYYNNFWDTTQLSDKEKELQKQVIIFDHFKFKLYSIYTYVERVNFTITQYCDDSLLLLYITTYCRIALQKKIF